MKTKRKSKKPVVELSYKEELILEQVWQSTKRYRHRLRNNFLRLHLFWEYLENEWPVLAVKYFYVKSIEDDTKSLLKRY